MQCFMQEFPQAWLPHLLPDIRADSQAVVAAEAVAEAGKLFLSDIIIL
jgi:hypothetical protein